MSEGTWHNLAFPVMWKAGGWGDSLVGKQGPEFAPQNPH